MDPRAFRQWSPPTVIGGRAVAGILSKADPPGFHMPSVRRDKASQAMSGTSMPTVGVSDAPKPKTPTSSQPSLFQKPSPGSKMPSVSAQSAGMASPPSPTQQKQQVQAHRPIEKPGSPQLEMFAQHGAKKQAEAGHVPGEHGQVEMRFGGAFDSRSKSPPKPPKVETIGQHSDRMAKENAQWDQKIGQAKTREQISDLKAKTADLRDKTAQIKDKQAQQKQIASNYASASPDQRKMLDQGGLRPKPEDMPSPPSAGGTGTPAKPSGLSGAKPTVAPQGPKAAGPNVLGNLGFGYGIGSNVGAMGGPAAATSMIAHRGAAVAHGAMQPQGTQVRDSGRLQREAYQQRAEMLRRTPITSATKALQAFNALTPPVRGATRTFQ